MTDANETVRVALLVVGGGPAALSAARAYGENGGQGPVWLVSDDDTAPYLRPPLSKEYLRGESGEDDLPLESDAFWSDVTLRLRTMVTTLGADDRSAVLDDGTEIIFDHCVLATGNSPAPLPVPGADDPRVRYLRSLASARALREAAGDARSAVVVGSGFIGCEAAVSLARLGLTVTVCSREPAPQSTRLGDDVAGRLARWLREENVVLFGETGVTGIEDGRIAHVPGHPPIVADLVLVAAGVEPNSTLAVATGLDMEQERVVVDEGMRSSTPTVLAAGDVAFARNAAAGRHLPVEHWGEAEAMGAIAGATAAGATASWDSPPGFWTVIGDRVLKYAGWGDGWDDVELVGHDDGGFTAWYSSDGTIVGVATHEADDDYERGSELVRTGASVSEVRRAEQASQV
ncbi:NAD(P)/FAD-dependent oxidoreductase [Pseudonocardia endophytica]|uniref:Pyridine nucleotide-disulfide oxidoreductase n=1 Tax=Pseudonocardia endophytica TaxID=401976 RepID=A0A4R1HL79_PSEEN|nr:FAD-dependent oxidoreductase [Pseudonocardia endophytica]TCK21763.1 pyridine nucleotide-disulfide oxidoreductase [Pseudonocardia endophytica]